MHHVCHKTYTFDWFKNPAPVNLWVIPLFTKVYTILRCLAGFLPGRSIAAISSWQEMCHTLGGKARSPEGGWGILAWNVQTLAGVWSLIWRIRLGGFLPGNPLAGHDHVFWRHRFDQAAAGTSWHFKGEVYSQYFLIHGFVLDMYDSFHFNYLANNLKSSMGLYNLYQIALLGRSMLVLVWVVSTPIQKPLFVLSVGGSRREAWVWPCRSVDQATFSAQDVGGNWRLVAGQGMARLAASQFETEESKFWTFLRENWKVCGICLLHFREKTTKQWFLLEAWKLGKIQVYSNSWTYSNWITCSFPVWWFCVGTKRYRNWLKNCPFVKHCHGPFTSNPIRRPMEITAFPETHSQFAPENRPFATSHKE